MGTAIHAADRHVLRRLAGRVREIADLPEMQRRKDRLAALNALRPDRPVVLCFPEGSWRELVALDDVLECRDRRLRSFEAALRRQIYWWEHIRDDHVLEPWFGVHWVVDSGDFGVASPKTHGANRGSYTWDPPIKDLDGDFGKLHFRRPTVDRQAGERLFEQAGDIFGDLLPPRRQCHLPWSVGLGWTAIDLIGMEKLMLAMYDEPGSLHRFMQFLSDEMANTLDWCQAEGLLVVRNHNEYVGSGGVAYTDELPADDLLPGGPARLKDLWGFAESQETVGVSPEMFGEFIFPYQVPLLARFGLTCYGCCEPVHERWNYIKTLAGLRRVSVSPWCDQEKMAEYMGGDYVFSRKPNPAMICASFNADHIRADIRRTLEIAGQCPLEIIMKDTHTVQHEPDRITRWVRIALEEVDRYVS